MRFRMFGHADRRNDVGIAQQYEERLQFAATADAAGFYCYHVAEHHHSPLCLAPNQAVYLAAVAQRTQRLRLLTLVYVLPLHNPIRLIEEICLIDQLSNGRFEVGVGRGTPIGPRSGACGEATPVRTMRASRRRWRSSSRACNANSCRTAGSYTTSRICGWSCSRASSRY